MSNYKKQQKFYSKHEFKNCPEVYGKNIEIINDHQDYNTGIYSNNSIMDFILLKKSSERGGCFFSNRDFDFKVTDLNLVKDFSISNLIFNSYLQVELNDHLVYLGPKGEKSLEVVSLLHGDRNTNRYSCESTNSQPTEYEPKVYNGKEFLTCDNNQLWAVDAKINLKPFLQSGNNSLHLRMFEGSQENRVELEIHTTEYCPLLLSGEETSSFFVESSNN